MKTKQRIIYSITTAGAAVGMVASFLEVLEYQELLKNSHAMLTCDLNSVFSCSSVLNAWQSKVFGFPNSLMCLVFFTIMFATALVGLTGGTLVRKLRLSLEAISVFFLCFALWFLWESTYKINALCFLCIFCFGGLLMLNWGWLRINASDFPTSQRGRKILAKVISSGMDIFGWLLIGIVVAFAMIMRFA